MSVRRDAVTLSHPIIITFLALVVIAFMSYAAEVLKPLAFAVLLSFALAPVSRLIHRCGVPRTLAAALTVVFALALLGVVGYQVGQQLTAMAAKLPVYEDNLIAKLERFRPDGEGVLEKTTRVVHDVTQTLTKREKEGQPEEPGDRPIDVRVVAHPALQDRIRDVFGPTLEYLGSSAFILILVFFLLINREELTERLIRLVGTQRVTMTTKTMEEIDQRISRYLVTFALVNSTIGLVVAAGLRLIGVEYAMLWGVLAGLFRFIPYVGPGMAFLLPFAFSIASAPGADWQMPLMVLGLFAIIEIIANSYLEPVIYGKTTGVSSFGLLVAAMFWTWLWGAIGLLLSTPLTVCLAVLGKYVPGMSAFHTLLGEEPPLTPDVKFYQRLMAMDHDGATEMIDDLLKCRPRAEVFDEVLIPALSQAERDQARADIDERELAFVWRVIDDLLNDLAEAPEYDLKALSAACPPKNGPAAPEHVLSCAVTILGVPANDRADALVLRMLDVLLRPSGYTLTIVEEPKTPLKLAEHVVDVKPALVIISHVPPDGLTNTRYQVRRLRARAADLLLLTGCWGPAAELQSAADPLKAAGSTGVLFRLQDARARIVELLEPAGPSDAAPGPDRAAAVAARN